MVKLTIRIPENQLGHSTFKHGGVKLPCIGALGAQKKFGSLGHCSGKTTQFDFSCEKVRPVSTENELKFCDFS